SQIGRGLATPSITGTPAATVQALATANRAAARDALIASDGLETLIAATGAAAAETHGSAVEARRHAAALETVARAQDGTTVSARQAATATEDLAHSQAQAADESQAVAGGISLTGHQVQGLTYQLQDMAAQLAGGQSPFLVMLQQLPQAADAVGGFANLFRLILNPAVLATTAVVVGLGGGIALVASRIATTDSQVKALAISMRDLS
ncbi:phage tail length tape measure family protein, partial [Insolitispirillum peregrinum]|uniref:phage tail length tape measure family protein n=1 Tax=Insolitispirillum peregrinum TaxID=80876 RepID=UPI0036090944